MKYWCYFSILLCVYPPTVWFDLESWYFKLLFFLYCILTKKASQELCWLELVTRTGLAFKSWSVVTCRAAVLKYQLYIILGKLICISCTSHLQHLPVSDINSNSKKRSDVDLSWQIHLHFLLRAYNFLKSKMAPACSADGVL